jgi:uncharacterized protein YqgC (DUF456 family)
VEYPLILLAGFLQVVGLVGCVLPILPGPPISYVGLLVLWGVRGWDAGTFGLTAVLVLGALTVLVTIVDTIAPVIGAKRYGASKAGVWGSILGMLVGMIWFPPFGMLAGAFLGALAGEWLIGQTDGKAMRAAWGVFVGTMAGVVLKLAVSIAIAYVFVRELV